MNLRITVLPGDGIGPEVTKHAVRTLETVASVCGYHFTFTTHAVGGAAVMESGSPLPRATLDACLQSDAVLLGAVGGPQFDTLPKAKRPETGLLQLRSALGCFANLRPVRAFKQTYDRSPLRRDVIERTDMIIVRELLGGLYFGEPREIAEDGSAAFNTMRYTRAEVERVAKVAFDLARGRKQKLASVDKANVLETSRLWRETVTDVARSYPDVALEHCYVDSFAMQMITTPARYDVVLTENLFGDILSDEAAVISGSLGMLASGSVGGKVDLYEPIHGSAPTIAGKDIANPIGAIASAAMLLRFTGKLEAEAREVEQAIESTLSRGLCTADIVPLGSTAKAAASTSEVGGAIESAVAELISQRFAYHAV